MLYAKLRQIIYLFIYLFIHFDPNHTIQTLQQGLSSMKIYM